MILYEHHTIIHRDMMTESIAIITPQLVKDTPMEVVTHWVDSLDLKDRTKDSYRKNISYYLSWLEATGRTGALRDDVLQYKKYLSDVMGYRASTVSAYMTAVRTFYTWLQLEYNVMNVSEGVKGCKKPAGFRKDPLSAEQIKMVLSSIDMTAPAGIRDYALVCLMVRTGLRDIEVQRANINDIRTVSGHTVLFVQGKGKDEKDCFVILSAPVLRALQTYIQSRGERMDSDAPLFASMSDRNAGGRLTTRSISRIVKQSFVNVGLDSERYTAHSLRHTAITLALLGGATVQQAQSMARHSNINTTMIYAHNIDRMEDPAESYIDKMLGESY